MAEILNYMGVGGLILIFASVFIEIVPFKINPIGWIGNRFNAGIREKVSKLEEKVDDHIAKSYRDRIFYFQNELLSNIEHTQEEFDNVLEACSYYTKFCEENEVQNDKCSMAIAYIKRIYKRCQDERRFVNLPGQEKKDA